MGARPTSVFWNALSTNSATAAKPSPGAKKTVLALADDDDRLAIRDRELYWLPSGGLMESQLDQDAIEAVLGLSTRRTKGTMEQVAAKFFAD